MIASGYQIMVKQIASERPILEDLSRVFPKGAPKPGTLTEISGVPGTGRSEMLLRIIARTVLPHAYGGKSSKVILMDLNHKVDQVDEVLRDVVTANGTFTVQEDITDIVKNGLGSIINVACYSSEQFDLALDELEDLLWDNEDVSLLAIDGLDAFYWEDCYLRLQRMATHYKRLCQRLKAICREHNICCIYTLDDNYLQSKSSKNKFPSKNVFP
ncbi:DNA repair protein XRCC2 [Stomoxys calcitrans]|uniref:Uncharacterized protein n=1 Tax=Stomoxys calcitrans TaxID=35570 RepID=A0A1I8NPE6_STOCA|nr:DNA repair protein XRCC2 [Stomoxys calcitrans]